MKIVLIQGGLGNQMFQYAFYKSLELIYNSEEVKVDISSHYNCDSKHNGYELKKIFEIDCSIASKKEIKKCKSAKTFIEKNSTFYSKVFDIDGDAYLIGYWQSEKYFTKIKKTILNQFKFPIINDTYNLSYVKKIQESESVAVHIRRGDYLDPEIKNVHHVCDLEFYNKSISYVNDEVCNPLFFIFSDDINWCKENFIGEKFVFIENNTKGKNFIDMYLMSLCKHNIIANSSFSWWGAYLGYQYNANKICVAPEQWYGFNAIVHRIDDILPKTWHKINLYKCHLVSVIIIVNSTNEYFKNHLRNVINQTYKNLEIIVIYNCSIEDRNFVIDIDNENDSRIKLITLSQKKNLSEVKNLGIKNVTGEYICFVSDTNYLKNSFIENMLNFALANSANVVSCETDLCNHNYSEAELNKNLSLEENWTGKVHELTQITQFLLKGNVNTIFNKLYNSKFIMDNRISFHNLQYGENLYLNIEIITLTSKIFNVKKLSDNNFDPKNQVEVTVSENFNYILQGLKLSYELLVKENLYQKYYEEFIYLAYLTGWDRVKISKNFFETYYREFKNFFINILNNNNPDYIFFDKTERIIINTVVNMSACQYQIRKREYLQDFYKYPQITNTMNIDLSIFAGIKFKIKSFLLTLIKQL